jgi:hypothetical protein
VSNCRLLLCFAILVNLNLGCAEAEGTLDVAIRSSVVSWASVVDSLILGTADPNNAALAEDVLRVVNDHSQAEAMAQKHPENAHLLFFSAVNDDWSARDPELLVVSATAGSLEATTALAGYQVSSKHYVVGVQNAIWSLAHGDVWAIPIIEAGIGECVDEDLASAALSLVYSMEMSVHPAAPIDPTLATEAGVKAIGQYGQIENASVRAWCDTFRQVLDKGDMLMVGKELIRVIEDGEIQRNAGK